jgi:glutamyl-tRNA synthetase
VRLHVPEGESIDVDDAIKGPVHFDSRNIGGDFIIVRSDGVPIFNYIVIIDDALMKITHVIRGEDHLPNTPKQIMVARALGLPVPNYAHLPLVLGDDRKKLSKRHGITSVENYRSEGYLPEALLNYIAMMGWCAANGEEIMPAEKIAEQIDLSSLGKAAAVFDFTKLRWMNANYIRSYDLAKITDLFVPYLKKAGFDTDALLRAELEKRIDIMRGSCELLSDIVKTAPIFLRETPDPDEEADALLKTEEGKKAAAAAFELMGGEITAENFDTLINAIKAKTGLKGKNLFHPCRALFTSSLHGPDLAEAMKILGYDICAKRVRNIHERYC